MGSNGKHSARKENSIGKIIKTIFILIVLVIVVGVLYFLYNEIMNNQNIESTENGPIISYSDEKTQLKVKINEGEVLNQKVVLNFDKGNAKISKNGDKYTNYEGEALEDGSYTVIAQANDKTATKLSFIIDTQVPKISGLKGDYFERAITIKLEDLDDTKTATLTKTGSEQAPIDLKKQPNLQYTVNDNGEYTIFLEDYHNNSYTSKFIIDK